MKTTFIFGHTSPDTDSVASAISATYLHNQINLPSRAFMLGSLSAETKFALDTFNIEKPELLESIEEDQLVCLVDHNEFAQSVKGIEKANIIAVVDHHRVANFETKNPLFMHLEPVGCTCTIIYNMFLEHKITIPKNIAGIMLSAILSDTMVFKSPTCTKKDVEAAKELEKIAEVNSLEYGVELLKAGTAIDHLTPLQLLELDAKSFNIANLNMRIAQINVVDYEQVFTKKNDLEIQMKQINEIQKFDLFILIVTDILNSNSKALVIGENTNYFEKAFNVTLENNTAILNGVLSRKKQVVPVLEKA